MSKFETTKQKLPKLWELIPAQAKEITNLQSFDVRFNTETTLKNTGTTVLDTTLVLKDLYKFTGVTFTTDVSQAVPSELYDYDGTAYTFNHPIFGFSVPQGEDPNITVGGSWEFQTTVATVKTVVFYRDLPDQFATSSKIVSYLYTPNNTVSIPDLAVEIDPILETYADYNTFHRWIKDANGYTLEYYAFFPYLNDIDLRLDAKVIFYNFGEMYGIQNNKV